MPFYRCSGGGVYRVTIPNITLTKDKTGGNVIPLRNYIPATIVNATKAVVLNKAYPEETWIDAMVTTVFIDTGLTAYLNTSHTQKYELEFLFFY